MKQFDDREFENGEYQGKEEIYSISIRSGKRTYFLDVKTSPKSDPYLTITESKRKTDVQTGDFSYEKHKIVLQREDLSAFYTGLQNVITFMDALPSSFQPFDNDTDGFELTIDNDNE